jgi:hypothetical protein
MKESEVLKIEELESESELFVYRLHSPGCYVVKGSV